MTKRGKIFSRFSDTLFYQQVGSENIVRVKNYPAGNLEASDISILSARLEDYYSPDNNRAFATYSNGLSVADDGRICCSMMMSSNDGRPVEVKIIRESLGKLMEVLFVFKFAGIEMDSAAEKGSGSTLPLSSVLMFYRLALDKELSDEDTMWDYLNNEIEKFVTYASANDDVGKIADYIISRLCIEKR